MMRLILNCISSVSHYPMRLGQERRMSTILKPFIGGNPDVNLNGVPGFSTEDGAITMVKTHSALHHFAATYAVDNAVADHGLALFGEFIRAARSCNRTLNLKNAADNALVLAILKAERSCWRIPNWHWILPFRVLGQPRRWANVSQLSSRRKRCKRVLMPQIYRL